MQALVPIWNPLKLAAAKHVQRSIKHPIKNSAKVSKENAKNKKAAISSATVPASADDFSIAYGVEDILVG